jgi:dolichol-phosphate mannosyltransferase
MDLAVGEAVVVMDADLQDPPEVVIEMSRMWRQGYEIVYGVREDRSTDSVFKRWTARLFYRGLRRLTDVDIPVDVGDFRLVDRRAIDAFKGMREGSRFVRGMFSWMGFKAIGVPYTRDARYAGETKYPFRKMLKLATDGIVGFSRLPLRLALNIGFVVSALAVLGGISALTLKVAGIYTVPGWSSIVIPVCLLGGLQLGVLGVMGEYIGRTYEESLGRPLYIVDELQGIAAPFEAVPRAIIAGPRTLASLVGQDMAAEVRVVGNAS